MRPHLSSHTKPFSTSLTPSPSSLCFYPSSFSGPPDGSLRPRPETPRPTSTPLAIPPEARTAVGMRMQAASSTSTASRTIARPSSRYAVKRFRTRRSSMEAVVVSCRRSDDWYKLKGFGRIARGRTLDGDRWLIVDGPDMLTCYCMQLLLISASVSAYMLHFLHMYSHMVVRRKVEFTVCDELFCLCFRIMIRSCLLRVLTSLVSTQLQPN